VDDERQSSKYLLGRSASTTHMAAEQSTHPQCTVLCRCSYPRHRRQEQRSPRRLVYL